LKEPIHTIMDDLIAKYLLQEATAMEIAQVDAWVAESDANKKAFEHFKFLWDESKKIATTNTADENAYKKIFMDASCSSSAGASCMRLVFAK
jgi:transmembrane sensor